MRVESVIDGERVTAGRSTPFGLLATFPSEGKAIGKRALLRKVRVSSNEIRLLSSPSPLRRRVGMRPFSAQRNAHNHDIHCMRKKEMSDGDIYRTA
jgi:hypothetical protein